MFENSLRYQFALFFQALTPGSEPAPLKKAMGLADLITQGVEGVDSALLKLREPELGQAIVLSQTGGEQQTTISWAPAAGVWNMTWNATRLDLFCDAAAYREIAKQPLSPLASAKRVASALAQVPAFLGVKATRVAMVATGQESSKNVNPLQLIGGLLGSDTIREAAEPIPEIIVRLNRATKWNLSGVPNAVVINRLETLSSNVGEYAPLPSQSRFVWQLDFSTDARAQYPIPGQAVEHFIGKAAEEIEPRLTQVGEHPNAN